MPSEDSPVGAEIVRHVAALARLRVPEAELEAWTRQLARIVSYIDQLKEIADEPSAPHDPEPTPLRDDAASEGFGRQALEANSGQLAHGYGVVPRVVAGGKP